MDSLQSSRYFRLALQVCHLVNKSSFSIILLFCVTIGSAFSQPVDLADLKKKLASHKTQDTTMVKILDDLSYQYQWADFKLSIKYAEESLKLAERLSYKKGIAMANFRKAHSYWSLGASALSIEKALLAADMAEKENFVDILAECFRIIAFNYRDQQEIEQAEMYIKRAEKLSLQIKNWDLVARIYNLAGVISSSKNRSDTAASLAFYKKALSVAETHHVSKFHVCQILANIGGVYMRNDPDKAIKYFNRALLIAIEAGNRSSEAGILSDLGNAFAIKKRYKEADSYFQKSLSLARALGLRRIVRHAYESLSYSKVQEGKSAEVIQYLKKYYEVRDSMSVTREIVELEARYETEKKEQAIKLLEQEKRIQTIWNYVIAVGSLLLIAALIIIYRLQKLHTRNVKGLLEVQKELNSKLKETDLLKSRFFANISHEFRTPLSLILAPITDRLASPLLTESDKEYLRPVNRNAIRLLDLVNQLLDLSKLEVGKMKLRVQPGNLEEFIKVLSASFDSFAEARKITFKKTIQVQSSNVWFDQDKIEKIISNILFNAFKFTPAGNSVDLLIQSSAEGDELIIKVEDTGIGISAEEIPHVFSIFYQSKNIADDGQSGSGLGLSLVNELVKLHNGKIDLTSQLNQGTTIFISLPITLENLPQDVEISTAISEIVPASIIKPLHLSDENGNSEGDILYDSILIVEDNPELRNYIASTFKKQFKIISAKDGEEGLRLAIETVPDLIISDVMMPNMNGLDLTEKLKTDERTSHIPVILLTAKIDEGSRLEGFRIGADDYLSKPFSTEELRVRVLNLIESRKKLAIKYRENISIKKESNHIPTLDERFLLNLRSIIEKHLHNSSFSVELLSEEMCLSRTQLFRKVKSMIEISPNELINDIRLQRAAELIRAKADTLTQISYSVGFNEQSYFAKRFRKKFGMTPSEYSTMHP